MKYQLSRLRNYLNGHRLFVAVLLIIVLAWGAAFVTFARNADESLRAREVAARAQADEVGVRLDEIKQKREAEQKAAEQKKKAQEEAAKKAREAQKKPAQAPPTADAPCNTARTHTNPAAVDVLVNKKHCLVPLTFAPADLVTTHGATISAKAAADFNRMFADAAAAGQPFTVSSSYRSYQTQVATYNHWVTVNGKQAADTVSARPGYSEHQTGLAVDVAAGNCALDCFGGTTQYRWFQDNAANYGFIQRYYAGYEHITGYASEEWHYRYVGQAVARDMRARGLKTLEQYWGVPGGDYR